MLVDNSEHTASEITCHKVVELLCNKQSSGYNQKDSDRESDNEQKESDHETDDEQKKSDDVNQFHESNNEIRREIRKKTYKHIFTFNTPSMHLYVKFTYTIFSK